jgi:hypothetical protein
MCDTAVYNKLKSMFFHEISGSHDGECEDDSLLKKKLILVEVYRRFRGAYCLHNHDDIYIYIGLHKKQEWIPVCIRRRNEDL